MGMDLNGAGGYFRWHISDWPKVMKLAFENGWEPLGDEAPKGAPELEASLPHGTQRFADRDESEMSDAIAETIMQIVDRLEAERPKNIPLDYLCNDGRRVSAEEASAIADALEKALEKVPRAKPAATNDYRDLDSLENYEAHVREFIMYCRKGHFYID